MFRTGTASPLCSRDRQDEPPWPCSLAEGHIEESEAAKEMGFGEKM